MNNKKKYLYTVYTYYIYHNLYLLVKFDKLILNYNSKILCNLIYTFLIYNYIIIYDFNKYIYILNYIIIIIIIIINK